MNIHLQRIAEHLFTPAQQTLFQLCARHRHPGPGVPVSRAQLEERLLGWGEEVLSNALEVNVHNIRRKLGSDSILNIRGVGYFVPRHDQQWSR